MLAPPGSQLVFQQTVLGASIAPGNSDPKFNEWLGRGNDVKLFVIADRIVGSGFIEVAVMDTPDEEVFGAVSFSAQVAVAAGSSTVWGPTDTEAVRLRPGLGFRRLLVFATSTVTTARVRVWASERGGRRTFNRLLLSERFYDSAIYTQGEACAGLAGVDKVAIGVFAEEVASGSTMTVQMEESPNGRTWQNAQTFPELDAVDITAAPFQVFGVSDALPLSGFVRFRVQLGEIASPTAAVRLWATGRDVHPG